MNGLPFTAKSKPFIISKLILRIIPGGFIPDSAQPLLVDVLADTTNFRAFGEYPVFTKYAESWKNHPAMNVTFLLVLAICWGLYALVVYYDMPYGSNGVNSIVFAISVLCLLFPLFQNVKKFTLCFIHYLLIIVTLIPALANGTHMLKESGLFG